MEKRLNRFRSMLLSSHCFNYSHEKYLILVLLFILFTFSYILGKEEKLKKYEILIEYMYLYDFDGDTTSEVYYDFQDIRKNDNRIGFVFSIPFFSGFIKIDLIAAYSFLYCMKKNFKSIVAVFNPPTNEFSFENYTVTQRGNVIVLSIIPCITFNNVQFGIGPSVSRIYKKLNGILTIDYPSNPSKNSSEKFKDTSFFSSISYLHFRSCVKIQRFGFGYSCDILKNKHGLHLNFSLKKGIID